MCRRQWWWWWWWWWVGEDETYRQKRCSTGGEDGRLDWRRVRGEGHVSTRLQSWRRRTGRQTGGRGRRQEKRMAKTKGGSQANGSPLTALDVSLVDGLEGAETLAPACGWWWWWHGTLGSAATKKKAPNSSSAPTVKHAIAPCEQADGCRVCASRTYMAWQSSPRAVAISRERLNRFVVLASHCWFIDNQPILASTPLDSIPTHRPARRLDWDWLD